MSGFGDDFDCVDDLSFDLRDAKSDTEALLQALIRRLTTPAGGLFYAPTYGEDVRSWLSAGVDLRVATMRAVGQLRQEERVRDASATATLIGDQLTLEARVDTEQGPFQLTVTVDKLKVVSGSLVRA